MRMGEPPHSATADAHIERSTAEQAKQALRPVRGEGLRQPRVGNAEDLVRKQGLLQN
jgi:hypothetical protein